MCLLDHILTCSSDRPALSPARLHELKAETLSTASTSTSTPQPVNNTVHRLAQALALIEQGIERKFLKAPLGMSATYGHTCPSMVL